MTSEEKEKRHKEEVRELVEMMQQEVNAARRAVGPSGA